MVVLVLVVLVVVCQEACLTWAALVVCPTWAVQEVLVAPRLRRLTKCNTCAMAYSQELMA